MPFLVSTTNSTCSPWYMWTTGTQITTTSTVRTNWNRGTTDYFANQAVYNPVVRTAAEIAAEDRRIAARNSERRRAQERAERLLLDNLSVEQQQEYKRHCHFTIRGRNNLRFRIRKGRSGNIDVIAPNGAIDYRLCAHPAMDVPDCDTMLAQKIMLELDQDSFMSVANRHAPPPAHLRQVMLALQ